MEDTPARPKATVKAVTIEVTQEHIDQATPLDSGHCMIADAIKAARPDAKAVNVDLATIRFTEPDTGRRLVYLTPELAQTALLAFDQGFPVPPFTLKLRRPAQIVNTRTYNKKGKSSGARKSHGLVSTRVVDDERGTDTHATSAGDAPVRMGGKLIPNGVLSNKRGRRRVFGMRQTRPGMGWRVKPGSEDPWNLEPDTENSAP